MQDNIFYVYQYLREDNTPYYIGKGSYDRINEYHGKNIKLPAKELRQFVKTDMSEKDAFDFEISLIKHYGRKLDGGILENIKLSRWVAQAGWKHSEETKMKISEKNSGKVRTEQQRTNYKGTKTAEHAEKIQQANLGKTISKDVKQKISDGLKGNVPWNKGITGTPWSLAKRTAYMKSKGVSE